MPTDSLNFLDAVAGLPEQLAAAHEAAAAVPVGSLPDASAVRNIVVLGMGGSGISGHVVSAAFNDELPVPVAVLSQIRTPAYVGPGTLAFAMSYSGGTEETLSMARSAVEKGAQLVAVSCGGELETLARDAARCTSPARPVTCRAPRSARSSRRCASCCSASASRRVHTRS